MPLITETEAESGKVGGSIPSPVLLRLLEAGGTSPGSGEEFCGSNHLEAGGTSPGSG